MAVGCMFGEVDKDKVVFTSGARPGDSIVITQGIAIEGTSILAREASEDLTHAGVDAQTIERAKELLFAPGISVSKAARIACETVDVHSMHDPTEGGLVSGLAEVARGAGVGLRINLESIPVLPECRAVCDALGLDPLGLIASGSLIATVDSEDAGTLVDALSREGIPAYEIGRITQQEEGLKAETSKGVIDLPTFDRDEIARFFGG